MKATTVEPNKPGTARMEEVQGPDVRDGAVLVENVAVGVCGTDVGFEPDVIIECTGVGQAIADSIWAVSADGTVCLPELGLEARRAYQLPMWRLK